MNIEIANRLVNLRKQNNLSQEALAEKLGISRQAVSKWERAEASPDTDNLILLARLYGVSLDELLRTEDEIPMPEDGAEEAWQGENFADSPTDEQCNDYEKYDSYSRYDKYEKYDEYSKYDKYENVHIGKDGIHVSEGNKQVHIDWQGIHVNEGNGKNVDVGWRGIHVQDSNRTQSDGEWRGIRIDESGETIWPKDNGCDLKPRLYFPVGLLVCIAYLVVGIVWKAWHPGWVLLFLIPVLETFIKAIQRRDAAVFAYPILTLGIFLAVGFLTNNWLGWIGFLTIPVYYSLVSYIKSLLAYRRWKKTQKATEVSGENSRKEA